VKSTPGKAPAIDRLQETEMESLKSAVFCDFDGTITSKETLSGMVSRLLPDRWKEIVAEMVARRMTLREGVKTLVESIPVSRYGEIIDFVMAVPMRPGLEELLDFLDGRGVPFIVLSGGLRGMVEARLGPLVKRVRGIYAVDTDLSGDYIRVSSEFEERPNSWTSRASSRSTARSG